MDVLDFPENLNLIDLVLNFQKFNFCNIYHHYCSSTVIAACIDCDSNDQWY